MAEIIVDTITTVQAQRSSQPQPPDPLCGGMGGARTDKGLEFVAVLCVAGPENPCKQRFPMKRTSHRCGWDCWGRARPSINWD